MNLEDMVIEGLPVGIAMKGVPGRNRYFTGYLERLMMSQGALSFLPWFLILQKLAIWLGFLSMTALD